MYIIDMRNGKKTYNVNVVKTVDFHSVILPLTLFGLGILVPVITDDIFVIIFSFVPYYGYTICNEKRFSVDSIFVSKVVVVVSLLLGLLLSVLASNGILELFKISGWILVLNVVPSFVFMVYTIFSVESRDPSKWSNYTIPPS